jgi:hypothetical protein
MCSGIKPLKNGYQIMKVRLLTARMRDYKQAKRKG